MTKKTYRTIIDIPDDQRRELTEEESTELTIIAIRIKKKAGILTESGEINYKFHEEEIDEDCPKCGHRMKGCLYRWIKHCENCKYREDV